MLDVILDTTHELAAFVHAALFRRMNEESRCNVDKWNALRGLPWDVTETGAEAAEAVQAPRPQIIHVLLTPRRRYVTRADLRKYCVTIVCSSSSDIAVHGKTSTPHGRVSYLDCRTNGARS